MDQLTAGTSDGAVINARHDPPGGRAQDGEITAPREPISVAESFDAATTKRHLGEFRRRGTTAGAGRDPRRRVSLSLPAPGLPGAPSPAGPPRFRYETATPPAPPGRSPPAPTTGTSPSTRSGERGDDVGNRAGSDRRNPVPADVSGLRIPGPHRRGALQDWSGGAPPDGQNAASCSSMKRLLAYARNDRERFGHNGFGERRVANGAVHQAAAGYRR